MQVTPPKARYRQIADAIRQAINNGEYPPGSMLPSEPELAKKFGIGRPTVHEALGVLRAQGLVRVERGRGTFVVERPKVRRLARNRQAREAREQGRGAFEAEMLALGKTSRTEHDQLGPVIPPEEVREKLKLAEDEQTLIRARRMYGDDEPMQLATSYVPWSIADGTPMVETDTGPGGLYSRLADVGHAPVRFSEEVGARLPNERERQFFSLEPSEPVFVIIRTAFDREWRPVEVNEMVLPADRWRLVYDWDA